MDKIYRGKSLIAGAVTIIVIRGCDNSGAISINQLLQQTFFWNIVIYFSYRVFGHITGAALQWSTKEKTGQYNE